MPVVQLRKLAQCVCWLYIKCCQSQAQQQYLVYCQQLIELIVPEMLMPSALEIS